MENSMKTLLSYVQNYDDILLREDSRDTEIEIAKTALLHQAEVVFGEDYREILVGLCNATLINAVLETSEEN